MSQDVNFCAIGRLKWYPAPCIEYQHVTAAVRDEAEAWDRHILDSAAMLPVLQEAAAAAGLRSSKLRVLDVGSGAGLPGIVLGHAHACMAGRCIAAQASPCGPVHLAKPFFLLVLVCSKLFRLRMLEETIFLNSLPMPCYSATLPGCVAFCLSLHLISVCHLEPHELFGKALEQQLYARQTGHLI